MTIKTTETPIDDCNDRQLVRWAVAHGWKYHHINDQLADPQGFMTTANNWGDVGVAVRGRIIAQMKHAGVRSLPLE